MVLRFATLLGIAASVGLTSRCADDPGLEEPVRSSSRAAPSQKGAQKRAQRKTAKPAPPPVPMKTIAKPKASCEAAKIDDLEIPVWLEDEGFVITRVMRQCVTLDGEKGFEPNTPWIAMGLPCTAGKGKIETQGKSYHTPKVVSFVISTSCPMEPVAISAVQTRGAEALGLSKRARLLAYNPFAVQYWEIPGTNEAGVGFSVALRSRHATRVIWRNFREKESLPIALYGRENAWVMGGRFFFVKGELIKESSYTFKLKVDSVEALSKEDMDAVKQRCERLRPRRPCHQVF